MKMECRTPLQERFRQCLVKRGGRDKQDMQMKSEGWWVYFKRFLCVWVGLYSLWFFLESTPKRLYSNETEYRDRRKQGASESNSTYHLSVWWQGCQKEKKSLPQYIRLDAVPSTSLCSPKIPLTSSRQLHQLVTFVFCARFSYSQYVNNRGQK